MGAVPEVRTAGELADYLLTLPREMKVVMASDAEGNGHSPLCDAREAMYLAHNTWSGDCYPVSEDIEDPWTRYTWEDESPPGAERVVELGPVN